jgi:hypothetical protein
MAARANHEHRGDGSSLRSLAVKYLCLDRDRTPCSLRRNVPQPFLPVLFARPHRRRRRRPDPALPARTLFSKGQLEVAENAKDRRLADLCFFLRQASLSSAGGLSGCSIMSFLTRSGCGASADVLCPPNPAGLTLTVLHLRLMNPPTVLKAKLGDSATSSRVYPNSIAATAPARTVAAGCRRQGFSSRSPGRWLASLDNGNAWRPHDVRHYSGNWIIRQLQ